MSIILAIIIGFFVGIIARALMPGPNPAGFILTSLLGIGGALMGKFVGQGLGLYQEGQPAGFFMSVLGAMLLLFILHLATKGRPS